MGKVLLSTIEYDSLLLGKKDSLQRELQSNKKNSEIVNGIEDYLDAICIDDLETNGSLYSWTRKAIEVLEKLLPGGEYIHKEHSEEDALKRYKQKYGNRE